jgi:hypothetical protein
MNDLTLELEPFEAWLKEQPDHATVGLAGVSGSCPIAKYFQSRGNVRVEVYTTFRSIGNGIRTSETNPPWAQCFIEKLDRYISFTAISKEVALHYLEACKKDGLV